MLGTLTAAAILAAGSMGAGLRMAALATAAEAVDDVADADAEAALPQTPGAVGTLWRDGGAVRRVHAEPEHRSVINDHESVRQFLAWMRDWEFVGWFSSDDIHEFYQNFTREHGYAEMTKAVLLPQIKTAPGVYADRMRLNDPARRADPALRRARRHLKSDRAWLYRISSHDEMAEERAREKAAA